jgi:hypothetical protein
MEKLTASFQLNNLTSNGKHLALASRWRVPILHLGVVASSTLAIVDAPGESIVMQCAWCSWAGGPSFLVLALKAGVQIWSADGKRVVLWSPLEPMIARELSTRPADPEKHAVGITALTAGGAHCLCVGTSVGSVLVFAHDPAMVSFTLAPSLQCGDADSLAADVAVTALAASTLADGRALLARADIAGAVQLWTTADAQAFVLGERLSGAAGASCTGVCARGHVVAAAYSNGEICLHSALTGRKLASVAAHARWINALAIHPTAFTLAAASDDGCVSIWTVAVRGDDDVVLSNYACWGVPDAQLCGVAFHGSDGKSVVASAYDSSGLTMWVLP